MKTLMTRITTEEAPLTPPAGGEPPARVPAWRSFAASDVLALVAVAAAVVLAYASNFAGLLKIWRTDPDYSHGFLVLPICIWILCKRWPGPDDERPAPWWGGWVLVLAALAARVYLHESGSTWSETATFLPVVAGLGLARLGWPTFRAVWPAFAFLTFCLPLPNALNRALSQPLQNLATTCSCKLLRLTGLWVMPEGNVIMVGNERLEVAAACNGLSMLMSLAATVAAFASILPMATWKRVILLGSIPFIALGSNVLRIAATAWCYYRFGAEVGSKYAHDLAGWLMMPTAMLLVGLELALMSWLIVEATETTRSLDLLSMNAAPKNWNTEGRS
jgi:exosortase